MTAARRAATSAAVAAALRPYHLAVGAAAAGLAAGPASAALVAALAAVPVAVACWAPRELAARTLAVGLVALTGGAWLAEARLRALDPGSARAAVGSSVATTVLLLEAPRPRRSGGRAAIVGWRGDRVLLQAPASVAWPAAPVGGRLAVRGRVVALRAHERWLVPRHVHAVLLASAVGDTGRRRGGTDGALDRARIRAERALAAAAPAAPGGLLRGMVLGQDGALPAALRDEMRRAGLSHLTAASGQNVMLLAALAVGAAFVIGLGLRARLVLVLVLIALYVPLAGAGPSIQRAGVMGAAGVAAVLLGRPAARWHAILLAAAVTLALNPLACREPGWQLSFAAVLGLVLLGPRLRDGLRRRGMPGAPAAAVAITAAATLATAPLVALHFDRTSLAALPANVLVAPAVAPAMWLGMLAAAAGQLSAGLAAPLAALAAWPAAYVAAVAHAAAALPWAEVAVPAPVVLAAVALLAAAVVRPRMRRALPAATLCALVAALSAAPAPARPPAGPRLAFLAVGQGDATLLQHGRRAVLVDAGPPGGSIVERLHEVGVRRLDVLVATHAQADHIGGAAEVLRRMPVGLVLDGRDGVREQHGAALAAAARRRGVRLVAARAGQTLRAGPLEMRIHWPPSDLPPPGADPNDRAIVAEATIGGSRVLLPADAESGVLSRLPLAPADVLKVSHHGSEDPGLPEVIARVRPRLAVIEVGRGNRFGHPARPTLAALRAARVPVRRTDRDGTVLVTPGRDGLLQVGRP